MIALDIIDIGIERQAKTNEGNLLSPDTIRISQFWLVAAFGYVTMCCVYITIVIVAAVVYIGVIIYLRVSYIWADLDTIRSFRKLVYSFLIHNLIIQFRLPF